MRMIHFEGKDMHRTDCSRMLEHDIANGSKLENIYSNISYCLKVRRFNFPSKIFRHLRYIENNRSPDGSHAIGECSVVFSTGHGTCNEIFCCIYYIPKDDSEISLYSFLELWMLFYKFCWDFEPVA